jgi:SAM-dependent methyltransferase
MRIDISDIPRHVLDAVVGAGAFSVAKRSSPTFWSRQPFWVYAVQLLIVVALMYGLYRLYARSLYSETYFVRQGREAFTNMDGDVVRAASGEVDDRAAAAADDEPETFSVVQSERYLERRGLELYDSFYADFYDDIVYDQNKNRFELEHIDKLTGLHRGDRRKKRILDVGSGTGHHLGLYRKNDFDAVGLEAAPGMAARARSNYPGVSVKVGSGLDSGLFPKRSFTHIQALYFTVYYMEDKARFFRNCFNWLRPGGYFIVHLVDRDEFDPIVNTGNPINMVSPQRYAKERITDSVVQFKGISYRARFALEPEEDYAEFQEIFRDDKSGKVRKNIHPFHMPPRKEIERAILDQGFTLKAVVDMVKCQYEYQYLYVFYKPAN